ncbi:hypothetical protein [Winogradskyella marincola]|uniref:O-antigen polysaccharide polymerase Wzy n=1 Tax=Winogradskyella marincola TaxID=3037795 RepID=A0ABT6FYA0_9FLAO|nr:hypothetical protein [Winogradskyella sp. YYF002]MDG4714773.1 hypothetical protein [Winogradskyella sp. YYF002]
MNGIKFKVLILAIILVLTQGLLDRLFFVSDIIGYIIDAVVLLAVVFYFRYSFKVPGAKFFLLFLVICFYIGFVNNNSVVETFLYLRYLIFTYLLFNQLYVSPLSIKQWNLLLKLLVVMIVLQGLGSAFNVFILQQRVEGYVGLMSSVGGTTATAFPVLISVMVSTYFLFKPKMTKQDWLWCGTVLISAFLVGYSSGKRGIYFYIPVYMFLTFMLAAKHLAVYSFFKKKIFNASSVLVVLFPLFIFGIQNSKGFSYSLDGSESASQTISSAISYAESYEGATDQYGRTIGRSNTSMRILGYSLSQPSFFFFGEGYGAMKSEAVKKTLGFRYGIVGFTRDLVSGGWFLMLGTMYLFYFIILKNKYYTTKGTKVLRTLLMLVFIGVHCFYSSDFSVSLKLTVFLVPVAVLINSPYQAHVLKHIVNIKKIAF